MELKNDPRIGLELSLKKVAIIATVLAVLVSTAIFIYTNLSSSSDTFAGTQGSGSSSWSYTGPAGIGDESTNRFYNNLDSVSYSQGSGTLTITNFGGNGTPWTQSSNSDKPRFKTGSAFEMNGHAVLRFDGTNDFMTMPDQSDLNSSGPVSERSFFLVIRTSNDISNRQVIYEEGGTIRGLNIYIYNGKLYYGGYNLYNDGDDAPWGFKYVSTSISKNTNYILSMIYDGSTDNSTSGHILGYLNGKLMGEATSVGQLYAHSSNIGLGSTQDDSYFETGKKTGDGEYWDGDLASFIMYNYALDSAERGILENHLASKFDISIDGDEFTMDTYGYCHNITGICKRSNVANTVATSGNILKIKNPRDLDNGEYLYFGHNLDTGSSTNGNPSGIKSRWNRKFIFEELGDVGNVDVVLNLNQTEFIINDANDIDLLVDNNDDGDMSNAQAISGTYDSTNNTITYTNVSIGDNTSLMIGSTSTANSLPVEFLYIKAELNDNAALVKWATATEINNSHFEIERSIDGREFTKIGREEGHGNSSNVIEYEYLDYDIPNQSAPVYYRLKQVDYDGAFDYSAIVYVTSGDEQKAKVYPNPASSVINVSKQGARFNVRLLDQRGMTMKLMEDIYDQVQIPVQNIPNGYYIIQVEDESGSESQKILVRH